MMQVATEPTAGAMFDVSQVVSISDLGNVQRHVAFTNACLYSGGAARLTELKRALCSFGQGKQLPVIECHLDMALWNLEFDCRETISSGRSKADVFNHWKRLVVEQMVVDGAVGQAVADVEGMMWVEDEIPAPNPQHDPVSVRFDGYAVAVSKSQNESFSDVVPTASSATGAGGASSPARKGGDV